MVVRTATEPSSGVMATEPDIPHPCEVCPLRSTAENSSFGYCEGCEQRERLCLSCGEHRPQVGWGWGLAGVAWCLIRWVCAGCRFPSEDRRGPDRFQVALDLEPGPDRTLLAYELDRAAQRNRSHPVSEVLSAAARSIEAGGKIDVDVAGFGQEDRRALLLVTTHLDGGVPPHLYGVAHRIHRGWAELVAEGEPPLPQAPPPPSVASRVAHLERPVPGS